MKLLAFTYLSLINSFLLLAMGDILLASPKFCISLIYYGELFTTLSISEEGITLLFFYYLFVFSNTVWASLFLRVNTLSVYWYFKYYTLCFFLQVCILIYF